MQLNIVVGEGEQVEADLLILQENGHYNISPEDVVDLAPGTYLIERFALAREIGEGSDGSLIIKAVIKLDDIGMIAVELERFPNTEIKKVPEEPVTDA